MIKTPLMGQDKTLQHSQFARGVFGGNSVTISAEHIFKIRMWAHEQSCGHPNTREALVDWVLNGASSGNISEGNQ